MLGALVGLLTLTGLPLGHYFAALPFALLAWSAPKNRRIGAVHIVGTLLAVFFWLASYGLLLRLMSHAEFISWLLCAVAAGLVATLLGEGPPRALDSRGASAVVEALPRGRRRVRGSRRLAEARRALSRRRCAQRITRKSSSVSSRFVSPRNVFQRGR